MKNNLIKFAFIVISMIFVQGAFAQLEKVEVDNQTDCSIECHVLDQNGNLMGTIIAAPTSLSYGCVNTAGGLVPTSVQFAANQTCVMFTVSVGSSYSCPNATCCCVNYGTTFTVSSWTSVAATIPCTSSTGTYCMTITIN